MCQIIVKEYGLNTQAFKKDIKDFDKFENLLAIKGGTKGGSEGYSAFVFFKNGDDKTAKIGAYANTFQTLKMNFLLEVDHLEFQPDCKIVMGLFSRQRPEMEKNNISATKLSPYTKNDINYYVHGTISNDCEVTAAVGKSIEIDTQVFEIISKPNIRRLEGLFSYISIDEKTLKVKMIDKGMGKYVGTHNGIQTYSTTNIFSKTGLKLAMLPGKNKLNEKTISLKIAFSGGMDSVLNTYKIFSDLEKKLDKLTSYDIETELVYFEYGCNAEEEEIASVNKFLDYLKNKNLFKKLSIGSYREDIDSLIYNLSIVSGEKSKLLDKDAVGDEKEAESTLAYVPFRNTLMTQLLVAQSQKEFDIFEEYPENYLIMVGLGLNLTDGQVYGDNNISWLENTEKMLSVGGKRFSDIKLLSPYINRTKINMLKEFKEEFGEEVLKDLLDISFSCYYPEDGKACGKCGSCLLRQEAISKNL